MSLEEQSVDFLSEIEIPQWIMQNINHLEDPSLNIQFPEQLQTERPENWSNDNAQSLDQELFMIPHKQHVSYQIGYMRDDHKRHQSMSDLEDSQQQNTLKEEKKGAKISKNGSKNMNERRNQTSRKYRSRRKQYIQKLEEENKFLKFKIDELQFKLYQLQTQLNKLKMKTNEGDQSIPNYHTNKSSCIQELQYLLENNAKDIDSYQRIDQKLNQCLTFDGKQKIDLLNYFMSELLENVITDKGFFFTDSLIKKKGIHRVDQNEPLSQLDHQVLKIFKLDLKTLKNIIKESEWNLIEQQSKKFQELWKKLYQVYLAIINQGFKVDGIMNPLKKRMQNFVGIENMLRLDLHFEKNKYRSDIREMRNLWFRELERENLKGEQQKILRR